jgi:hypothetical protein
MFAASFPRWSARILSVGLAILFVAIAIGAGIPPLWPANADTLAILLLVSSLIGLILAWRLERGGALTALAAAGAFYVLEFYRSGWQHAPTGWVYPLLLVTSLLYLVASLVACRGRGLS